MYKWKSHPPCLTANSRYNTPCSGAEEQLSSGIIPDLHCGGWNEKLSHRAYVTGEVIWYPFSLDHLVQALLPVFQALLELLPKAGSQGDCVKCCTNTEWNIGPYLEFETGRSEFVNDSMKRMLFTFRPTIIMLFEVFMEVKLFEEDPDMSWYVWILLPHKSSKNKA